MKIVKTDNFDRSGETPGCDEELVAAGVEEYYARQICKLLNSATRSPDYFKVVPDDYKLREFSP